MSERRPGQPEGPARQPVDGRFVDGQHLDGRELDWPWIEALARIEGEGHRAALDDAAAVLEAEASRTRLADRLQSARSVRLDLHGLHARGRVVRVGVDAVELDGIEGIWLVPLDRVLGIAGLDGALPDEGVERAWPSLASMARAWVGLRVDVLRAGWAPVRGVLRAVFADHLDLEREGERTVVPLAAVIALWRRSP